MSQEQFPGKLVKVIEGLSPLCIVQGRTTDYMQGVETGIDRFAEIGSYWYVSFVLDVPEESHEIFLSKFRWLLAAKEIAAERGVELQKCVWIDWDILWTGDISATSFKRFAEEFFFTPYDFLFRCGFAGQRRCAKYHSLLQTGIIGVSRFGLEEISRLLPELSYLVRTCQGRGGLFDQQAMIELLPKISEDACILIRQLDDLFAHHRVYAGQPFIHVAGHSKSQKLQIAQHVRRLRPL